MKAKDINAVGLPERAARTVERRAFIDRADRHGLTCAVQSRGGVAQAVVSVAELGRLLDVFEGTKQAEHFQLALLLERGDENAADVVAGMESFEAEEYAKVADRVFPGPVLA